MTRPRTVEDVGNQHGYLCPKCKKGDSISIACTTWVLLCTDGTDDSPEGGDHEWEQISGAACGCGWSGMVGNLRQVEVTD